MSVILRTVAASDRGKARENNEDAVHAGTRLVAVADGVGGGPSGEVASGIAIRTVSALEETLAAVPAGDSASALWEAITRANQQVRAAIEQDPRLDGMGTTVTAMLTTEQELIFVHIGDSRAYVLRDNALIQVTKDDTYVQGLVDRGVISVDEARFHPQKSLVTQALNGSEIHPALIAVTPQLGDRYLLCTDGLSDVVAGPKIAATLRDYPDLAACAQRLVDLALAAGAPDNVSIVIADVVSGASGV